ncbi:four helix bundle protein [Dokdonella soli]|uniref:Four helix bundle protein n=1 Tax=Dokdonella soli TaxID=529810 RepID=A0ABN1IEZ8_9GAMM
MRGETSGSVTRKHRRLDVWKDAVDLVELVYRTSASLPAEERYGLCSQLRRAAISVPTNIAEGSARRSTRDCLRFLDIARGSLVEIETLLVIARRLGMIEGDRNLDELTERTFARLSALIRSLSRKDHQPQ